jgi:peptidyl-prolyl cis-trans isomerase A (cyclophilin A)
MLALLALAAGYLPGSSLTVDQAVAISARQQEDEAAQKWKKENADFVAEWQKEEVEVQQGEAETEADINFQLPPLQLLRGSAKPAAAQPAQPQTPQAKGDLPMVLMDTTLGGIALRIRTDVSPKAGAEFLELVKKGMYDGCAIYRAENFVVQGGLRTPDGQVRDNPIGPFPLETGLPNRKGTVALARWSDPNSATGEFFINLQDNPNLDADPHQPGTGFGVFAEIAEGMEVAYKISKQPVHEGQGMHMLNTPVVIRSARST